MPKFIQDFQISFQIGGLLRGNEYIFRVRAENKFGLGDAAESEPVKAVDPYNVPSAPSSPSIDNVMGTSCSLTWERPASDGGAEISGSFVLICCSTCCIIL